MQYSAIDSDGNSERDYTTYLNTGALLEIVRALRSLERVVVVGSSPAVDNPFWKQFGDSSEIHVLSRRVVDDDTSIEVGVDDKLHELMLQDINSTSPHNRTLVLMSGDGNDNYGAATSFPVVIRQAIEKGWKVELWSWKRNTSEIYNQMTTEFGDQFAVILLDNARDEMVYQPKLTSPYRAAKSKRRRMHCHEMKHTHSVERAAIPVSATIHSSTVAELTTMPTSTIQRHSRNKTMRLKLRKRKLETFRSLQNNHAEDETDGGSKDGNDKLQ